MPGGEWDFHFNFHNRDKFDLDRYHQLLFQIRDEFEPLFKAQMKASEGTAEWSRSKKTDDPSSKQVEKKWQWHFWVSIVIIKDCT